MSILLVFGLAGFYSWNALSSDEGQGVIHPKGTNTFQNVTGDDSEADRRQWDSLYNTPTYVFGKEPSAFLRENVGLIPIGRALDIATGEGRNAVFLAKKGFSVIGVDISTIALSKARRLAKDSGVSIRTINSDLTDYTIPAESYDLIVNIDYLQRSLIPQIRKGLKRGGIVVFESDTIDQLKKDKGKTLRKDQLLKKGELRELFKDFEILIYREHDDGKHAKAAIIAKRP